MRRCITLVLVVTLLTTTGCRQLVCSLMGSVSGDPSLTPLEQQAEFLDAAEAHENYEQYGVWPGRDK